MSQLNFTIQSTNPVSTEFTNRGITTFRGAAEFIKKLPYRRNSNKNNLLTLFSDNCGTCSTKHAVLKTLADENNFNNVQLIVALFKMNSLNTKVVSTTLNQHGLAFIPEAHCYLKYDNQIMDFTKENFLPSNFTDDLLEELEILPMQINEYKVAYHKDYIATWLKNNPAIKITPEELWNIREQCIQDLSVN